VNRCHGKARSVTYACMRSFMRVPGHVGMCMCVCVHVALLIQHATRMRYYCDVICGPSGSTIFFNIIS
jgi:hypothetical protein